MRFFRIPERREEAAAAAFGWRVTVDPATREPHAFEGFGTSLAWWATAVGHMTPEEREPILRRFFSLADGALGLSVVRFNAGGGEQPGRDITMWPRAVMDGFRSAPDRPLDESADPGQRAVLRDAAHIAAEEGRELVVEVFGNSPPWWATVSGSVTGSSTAFGRPAPNLDPVFSRDYLRYLGDVADFIERDAGVRVVSISPFNEPTSRWWKLGGHQEGCHFKPEGIDALLREAACSRTVAGRIIAASEEWSLDQTLSTWDALGATARRAVGRLNVHTYDGADRVAVHALAGAAGLDVWVSEFGVGDESGRKLASAIVRDLRGLTPAAWVLWQAVSPDAWGLYVSDGNGRPKREAASLEVFARFARGLRPGMHLIGCDNPHAVAAMGEDSVAVVVDASSSAAPQMLEIDISRFSAAESIVAEIAVAGVLGKPTRVELAAGADGVVRFEMPASAVVALTALGCVPVEGGARGQA